MQTSFPPQPVPQTRTDAPDLREGEGLPYREHDASFPIGTLYSEAEVAAWWWGAERGLRPRVERALGPSEVGARELLREIRQWSSREARESAPGRGVSDESSQDADGLTPEACAYLERLLMDRAVRAAHHEGIVWSPLLSETLYDAPLPREGESAEDVRARDRGDAPAEDEARRAAFLAEAGRNFLNALGSEYAPGFFLALPQKTRVALVLAVGVDSLLSDRVLSRPSRFFTELLELMLSLPLTAEQAARLGERLAQEVYEGTERHDLVQALRTLRSRHGWAWQPRPGQVRVMLMKVDQMHDQRERDLYDEGPESGFISAEPVVRRDLYDAARARHALLYLIDQADRGGAFPGMEELLGRVAGRAAYLEWAASRPFPDPEGVEQIITAWTEEERWRRGVDLGAALVANPVVLQGAKARGWLLGNGQALVLRELLFKDVLEGDEARLAFRRLSTVMPASAKEYLEERAEAAARQLLRSDLGQLLSSENAPARMAAIQFLGRLPEADAVQDLLPPPEIANPKEKASLSSFDLPF
jgi:hypothetical protein